MENNNILVMSYGTLKRNQYNYPYMEAANGKYIDDVVSVNSNYEMISVNNAFPGIIRGESKFQGELFEVSEEGILYYLDALEGYPYMYNRGYIQVQSLTSNKIYKALVYVLTNEFIQSNNQVLSEKSIHIEFKNNVYNWI